MLLKNKRFIPYPFRRSWIVLGPESGAGNATEVVLPLRRWERAASDQMFCFKPNVLCSFLWAFLLRNCTDLWIRSICHIFHNTHVSVWVYSSLFCGNAKAHWKNSNMTEVEYNSYISPVGIKTLQPAFRLQLRLIIWLWPSYAAICLVCE